MKESVWILQTYRSRFTLGFGFLVFWWCIDDRHMDLVCCFLMRYGSFLELFECHELVYFSFSTMDLYNDMEMLSFSI